MTRSNVLDHTLAGVMLTYGKTHKGCQLEPNFASVLSLVPPTLAQSGVKAPQYSPNAGTLTQSQCNVRGTLQWQTKRRS